ncbi:GspH/FimT family protein [bacterium]|nr:GspH/FimT family protein [bacterium]
MGSQKGLTFIELGISICIISIFASISIATVICRLPQIRLNGAARQIMGDLMWSRSEAVSQGNEFKIFFLNNHQYLILDDDDNDGDIDSGEWTVIKDIQADYSGVTFNPIPTVDPVFQPRGTISACSIGLRNGNDTKSVKISIAGRVKIE